MRGPGVLAILAALVCVCGASAATTELSPNDQQFTQSLVSNGATIMSSVFEIAGCNVPVACSRGAAEEKAQLILIRLDRVDHDLTFVQDACLRAAGHAYVRAFRAYWQYGEAAATGRAAAAARAVTRADALANSAVDKLAACDFVDAAESVGFKINVEFRKVVAAATVLGRCESRACVASAGRGLDRAAQQARTKLQPFVDDAGGCVQSVAQSALKVLDRYRATGAAAARSDAGALLTAGRRLLAQQQALEDEARDCAYSVGS